ncbi:MAG: BatA domain-containing protein, partial [Bacteroidota bacterium]
MTFLNPLILIGLAAAAIPILLHLLNLRKLRTIEFSTLSFLKELQRTKIRRIKIRQWLLLLLRTLLVILIVMGFARPTLEGPLAGTFGERAKTTSVFLLDDSQSMTATDEQGEFLQQANDAALQVAGLLKEGDEVFLLRLSEVNAVAAGSTMQLIRNFELLRTTLQTRRPSYHHNTLEDALRLSAKLLAGSTNFNKEVYLFSDFQSGAIASKNSVAVAPEQLFAETVNVFTVEIGKRTPNNLGIESISVPTSIVEPGKAFLVRARLSNAGERAVDGFIVSLFLDGERVAQQSIDIASGSFADVEFTAVPKSPGILEGMVELESDDLEFDNRRYFTLEIPAEVRVLFVGSPADLQYLKLALTARETSTGSALQLREVTDERLAASDIGAADVIIFSDPRDLSA